jgi:adenosylcobinamide-GDP ribazoletransferase
MPADGGAAPIRGIRASFIFLTRLPVGGFPFRPEDYRWASAHAPLVGLVVGALCAAVFMLLRPAGALGAAALALGSSLLVTGAFHEDGLADTADALGGGYTRERVLEILKDSRVGSFGAAALGVSLIGRTALIAELGEKVLWALPLAFAAARVAPIWLMALLPYVTDDARSKSRDVSRGGKPQALVASLWLLIFAGTAHALGWVGWQKLVALGVALCAVAALTGFRYFRRVGGITGDFLGATEQLGELAALSVLAWTMA